MELNNKYLNHKAKKTNSDFNPEFNQRDVDFIKSSYVDQKVKVLVILRGPSGSGKSSLAK